MCGSVSHFGPRLARGRRSTPGSMLFQHRPANGKGEPRHESFSLSCPAIALVLLGSALVGCTAPTARPEATNPPPSSTQLPPAAAASIPTPQASIADFDQQFIDMMVPHHAGAVEMARIAQTRAQHAEIQALASNILLSQSAEIDQMRSWRRAWFGTADTPPMSRTPMVGSMRDASTMTMNTDVTVDMNKQAADLRGAPEPFDDAFIEAMIPHHQMAVTAARLAQQRTSHTEISTWRSQFWTRSSAKSGRCKRGDCSGTEAFGRT